jgi:hypothetical protein
VKDTKLLIKSLSFDLTVDEFREWQFKDQIIGNGDSKIRLPVSSLHKWFLVLITSLRQKKVTEQVPSAMILYTMETWSCHWIGPSKVQKFGQRPKCKAIHLCKLTIMLKSVLLIGSLLFSGVLSATKEWTLLVYLNGNNNLDDFGSLNLNQMETVGSTNDINIVVQWASLSTNSTKRLLIQKDDDSSKVTSPVVQELGGSVDMGSEKTLAEFLQWGIENYPANRYFIDVWDHGSGWHSLKGTQGLHLGDISFDQKTGHWISTENLAVVIGQAAGWIGHKVDLYASDACMMAMIEVADEMSEFVEIFAGSEEEEPGAGWPYDALLSRWAANPKMATSEVASILTEQYVKSYDDEATFSTFDISKLQALNAAISKLGSEIMNLGSSGKSQVLRALNSTQVFSYQDYGDLLDFISQLESQSVISSSTLDSVRTAAKEFVVANSATSDYNNRANGISMWLPNSLSEYEDSHAYTRYKGLHFHKHTNWGAVLDFLLFN